MSSQSDLLSKLMLHELLSPLARAEADIEFVRKFELRGSSWLSTAESQINAFMKDLKLKNKSELDQWRRAHCLTDDDLFKDYLEYKTKRKAVIDHMLKNTGETLFLRYKDKLDRVLYSLIRVEEEDLIYKLYYDIDAGDVEFGDASAIYSCGPESKTQGIIGPVDLTTPHPEIAARLRTASTRQLFSPFKADEWHTLIRLEYRYESEYNETTRQLLGGLLLGSKTSQLVSSITENYTDNL